VLKSDELQAIESRRRAQSVFNKMVKERDAKSLTESQNKQTAEAAKTVRLRALRLAKKAADKLEAEAKAKAEAKIKAGTPARKRTKKAKADATNEPDLG